MPLFTSGDVGISKHNAITPFLLAFKKILMDTDMCTSKIWVRLRSKLEIFNSEEFFFVVENLNRHGNMVKVDS